MSRWGSTIRNRRRWEPVGRPERPPGAVVGVGFRPGANRVLSFAENATTSTGTVTITGVDNDVDAADKTVTVSGTVSATSVTAPPTRTLTLEDDDAAGVTVSATALTVTEQDTAGDSYTVVLDTEPTHSVTVTVGGHAGTDVSLSASTLTFTTSNWDQAQTVTVTARNDDDRDPGAVGRFDRRERRRQHGDGDGDAGLGGGLHGDGGGGGGGPGGGRRFPPEREPGLELRRERDHEHGLGDDHGRRKRFGRGGQDRDGLGHRVGDQCDRAADPDADPRGRRRRDERAAVLHLVGGIRGGGERQDGGHGSP